MARHRARRERVEEVVVGAVVAEPEHEVRGLLAVGEDAAHVQALVHAEGADLDDLMPGEDLGRRACEMLVEVVQELARTPRSVLALRLAVVERDAARLALDVRAGHVGRDSTEEPLDRAQPGEVEVDERVPFPSGRTREVAVLGAEVQRETPEPLLEVASPAPAHDVHVGLGKRRERAQERADLRRRLREVRVQLELAERAVVVEHDRPRPRPVEAPPEPLLELGVDGRRPASSGRDGSSGRAG